MQIQNGIVYMYIYRDKIKKLIKSNIYKYLEFALFL